MALFQEKLAELVKTFSLNVLNITSEGNIYLVETNKGTAIAKTTSSKRGGEKVEILHDFNIPRYEGEVFRVLSRQDLKKVEAGQGIQCRNVFGLYSSAGHVGFASQESFGGSRFISTTKKLDLALGYHARAIKEGYDSPGVICKLQITGLDLSNSKKLSSLKWGGVTQRNFAVAMEEVLAELVIPQKNIITVQSVDEIKNSRKEQKETATKNIQENFDAFCKSKGLKPQRYADVQRKFISGDPITRRLFQEFTAFCKNS